MPTRDTTTAPRPARPARAATSRRKAAPAEPARELTRSIHNSRVPVFGIGEPYAIGTQGRSTEPRTLWSAIVSMRATERRAVANAIGAPDIMGETLLWLAQSTDRVRVQLDARGAVVGWSVGLGLPDGEVVGWLQVHPS